jgi:hypothetical protein
MALGILGSFCTRQWGDPNLREAVINLERVERPRRSTES